MSKENHTIRVWAWREGTRELVFSVDTPDPTVDRIEMREHLVTVDGDDAALPSGTRGSLGWERTDGRWRRLRTSEAHLEHRRG